MQEEANNEDMDFELEPNAELGDLSQTTTKLKKIKDDFKACDKEKLEYLTNWQKERADFQNYKKDEDKRILDRANFIKEKFLTDFLSVLDSFDMAMQNKEAWESVDKNWRIGIEYIFSQTLSALEKNGVTPIGEVGVKFDPAFYQAVETEETESAENDGLISAVIQKGYRMGDKIIRPARVKVYEIK